MPFPGFTNPTTLAINGANQLQDCSCCGEPYFDCSDCEDCPETVTVTLTDWTATQDTGGGSDTWVIDITASASRSGCGYYASSITGSCVFTASGGGGSSCLLIGDCTITCFEGSPNTWTVTFNFAGACCNFSRPEGSFPTSVFWYITGQTCPLGSYANDPGTFPVAPCGLAVICLSDPGTLVVS